MRQLWSGNVALYSRLQKDTTPLGKARLHYFWLNKSPWSDIDDYKAFLPGVPPRKLPGANFYPENMSKEDFESWLATLPEDQQKAAKGFFSVLRWKEHDSKSSPGAAKELVSIPYSEEYKDDLTQASSLLREAAAATDNASLKKFLNSRADAFLSNDYYESDLSWMDLDAPLDITIGPYETYNDEIFGYKAAFEAYVNVRDEEETEKLGAFTHLLQQIEDNLPIDPQYRNPKLGASAAIRVVDQILATGDGAHGVQTAAYNLPNDERVVQQKGSKRVMLKNVQEAKFRSVLLPIARRTLSQSAMVDVNFELFFTHILAHELMHGLGPHQISVQGRETNPRLELKELYSAIEEAKADVTGLFALQFLMTQADAGKLDAPMAHGAEAERQLYTTYLASSFPHHAVWIAGCPRARAGDAVQLFFGSGRIYGECGWDVQRGCGEDEGGGEVAGRQSADAGSYWGLCGGEGLDGKDGDTAAGDEAGSGAAEIGAHGYCADFRDARSEMKLAHSAGVTILAPKACAEGAQKEI